MPVIYSNNASTSLSAGINNSTTTIPIASSSGFPSISSGEYYFATIANTANTKIEVVKVTSGTTSLTVTRAQGGTSAQAFDSGDNFQLRVTADTLLAATQTDVKITSGSVSADTLIAKGDGSSADGQIQLNCSQNSHGIKLKSPPHSAGASYTLTFPNDDGDANQYLQTNGSGVLDWNTVDLTALSASSLTSGTVPAARITASSIANDLIDSQHIAADSIDAEHLAPNSVNTDAIVDASVRTAHIQNGDVTVDKLASNSVDSDELVNGSVDLSHMSANSVDSPQYVDGSIDTAHYAAGSVNLAAMKANSIDSDQYVDGSIDLAHMSSESVDEDNLYISNAGSNGQFLSKQSGNNGGLTWASVATPEDYIPNGSVMAFFQASAPTGWTKVTSQNNKVLRVVSGNGGGTGGTWATSSGVTTSTQAAHTHTSAAHTHTGASHTHSSAAHTHSSAAHTHAGGSLAAGAHTLSTAEMPSHTHTIYGSPWAGWGPGGRSVHPPYNSQTGATGGGGSHAHSLSGTSASTTPGATGSTTPGASGATTPGAGGSTTPGATGSAGGHSHTISAPQYIDVIICSKDA